MSDRKTATIARLRDRPVARPVETEGLVPGARVGRFVVLYRLGAGGMGSVHAAYDPQLDRKVAIKLLHREPAAEAGAAAVPELEREARALARLSHPNVVTVHELGTVDGRPFVAMELVEGRTLGDWLSGGERSWREVLRLFRAAGEGLAAAHDLGVVHQDFKPSNVMVTGDGGVRVLDFGLAAIGTQRAAGGESVWGTPPYVAPERLEGAPADPRGDQFGFCVALHEALWGRLPEWDAEGEPRRRPGRPRVPAALWDALARGLARRPGDRHPSMMSLLAALDFERRSRCRRRVLAVAAAVLAVTAAGYAALSSAPAELCGGGPERVAEVWNDGRRAEVLHAFRATGLPVADAAAALAGDRLDRFLTSWQGSYAEACRATHVLGEQSGQLLDRRMHCLDARLAEVDALAAIFASATPEIVLGAAESTHRLGDLERCADAVGLARLPELPADPAARRRIEAAAARLAGQRARQAAGQPPEAAVVEAVAETAREAGYLPLEAEALGVLTRWRIDFASGDENLAGGVTEQGLQQGFRAALASDDRERAIGLAIDAIRLVGYEQNRPEDVGWWRDYAGAALPTAGPGAGGLEVALETELGSLALRAGRFEEAGARYRRAVEIGERVWGPEDGRLVGPLTNLAMTGAADWEAKFDRALALIERDSGAWSNHLCGVLVNRAGNLAYEGRYRAAVADAERCLASLETAYGAPHRTMVYPLTLLGQLHNAADRPDAAERYLQRALPLAREAFGAEHPLVREVETAVVEAALLRLDPGAARPTVELLRLVEAFVSPARNLEAAMVEARWARLVGEEERARRLEGEVRERLGEVQPSGIRLRGLLLVGEGRLADGRADLARDWLEEAVEIERPAGDAHVAAAARFALARALAEVEPERAMRLAQAAQPGLAIGSPATHRRHAELVEWLNARTRSAGKGGTR